MKEGVPPKDQCPVGEVEVREQVLGSSTFLSLLLLGPTDVTVVVIKGPRDRLKKTPHQTNKQTTPKNKTKQNTVSVPE